MSGIYKNYNPYSYQSSQYALPQYAKTKDIERAIYYKRGENPNVGSEGTLKDSLVAMPLIVGMMGILNVGSFVIGNFRNLISATKDKFASFGNQYIGKSFAHHHLQGVINSTTNTLAGLKPTDPNLLKRVEEAKKRLSKINLNKVSPEKLRVVADEIKDIESKAIKIKNAMPVAKAGKGFWAKTWHGIKTPWRVFSNSKMMKKFSETTLGRYLGRSGGPFIMAMEGVMECFGEIIPAFKKGGLFSGIKQIGKSAVKMAASITGYVLGEAIFRGVAGALGAWLLGPFGIAAAGFGAVAGRFLGSVIGGTLLSLPFVKAAKFITGKSEKDQIRDKEVKAEAERIKYSQHELRMLAAKNLELAQQEIKSGNKNKRTKEALKFAAQINNATAV